MKKTFYQNTKFFIKRKVLLAVDRRQRRENAKVTNWDISSIEPLKDLCELEELNLAGTKITNLNGIEKLKNLKKLFLFACPITSIEELASLTQLEELNLSRTKITNLRNFNRFP